MPNPLHYGELKTLRRLNPAWRLLAANNAPLVISFLHHAFVVTSRRQIRESELLVHLDEHLQVARHASGPGSYPLTAREYLTQWMSVDAGWLRSSYMPRTEEPVIDLTAAAERAIEWIATLQQRPAFIGTQSRLLQIFDLLRQIKTGTEANPEVQLAELERRRKEIEGEIFRVCQGDVKLLSGVEIKERFLQASENAHRLLTDLRGVEQNFHQLDRQARQKIATWDAGKGALLSELFDGSDSIHQSEQGRSFVAFWDFLMSPERQAELGSLLDRALQLEDVRAVNDDPRLRSISRDWVAAADQAQRTVARLSEQLRRFLDDRTWVQNRRIVELIQTIERQCYALVEDPPEGEFMPMAAIGIDVYLPMDRSLFRPPKTVALAEEAVILGESIDSADALYDQVYVDPAVLEARIDNCLLDRDAVSVGDIVARYPLEFGLAEIIGYLRLAATSDRAFISDEQRESITWSAGDDKMRNATIPFTHFQR